MQRNRLLLPGFFLLALFLASCSQGGNTTQQAANASSTTPTAGGQPGGATKAPPADVVRPETASVELKAGGTAEASMKLTIAGGYHINANPASFSYLKATELQVEPGEGVTPGQPVYPPSVTRTFAFSKDPLAVYEGEATIKLPLSAASDAKRGAQTLKGKLRIQACDEEACYPPRTIETLIPVTVK